jgi:hypothetical protein
MDLSADKETIVWVTWYCSIPQLLSTFCCFCSFTNSPVNTNWLVFICSSNSPILHNLNPQHHYHKGLQSDLMINTWHRYAQTILNASKRFWRWIMSKILTYIIAHNSVRKTRRKKQLDDLGVDILKFARPVAGYFESVNFATRWLLASEGLFIYFKVPGPRLVYGAVHYKNVDLAVPNNTNT